MMHLIRYREEERSRSGHVEVAGLVKALCTDTDQNGREMTTGLF